IASALESPTPACALAPHPRLSQALGGRDHGENSRLPSIDAVHRHAASGRVAVCVELEAAQDAVLDARPEQVPGDRRTRTVGGRDRVEQHLCGLGHGGGGGRCLPLDRLLEGFDKAAPRGGGRRAGCTTGTLTTTPSADRPACWMSASAGKPSGARIWTRGPRAARRSLTSAGPLIARTPPRKTPSAPDLSIRFATSLKSRPPRSQPADPAMPTPSFLAVFRTLAAIAIPYGSWSSRTYSLLTPSCLAIRAWAAPWTSSAASTRAKLRTPWG